MELNETQKSVVNYDGNMLLLAQAGTGKTNTLALKMAHVLSENLATPKQILCLTFTNKGCMEIADRVKRQVGDAADEITVKTFHSYCLDVIKDKMLFDRCGVTDYSVFDEDDSAAVIKKAVVDTGLFSNRQEYFPCIYRLIDFIKKTAIEKGVLKDDITEACKIVLKNYYENQSVYFNERLKNIIFWCGGKFTSEFPLTAVQNFIAKYQSELELSHAYDFDDLEYYANLAVCDAGFLNLLKGRYKYVFIDEAQDTSFDEYNFIKRFIRGAKVCLSGDFFQTIYEWRGSDPDRIISDFKKSFKPETFVFDVNYRSSLYIAEASFCLIKNMFPERFKAYAGGLKAANSGGEPIYVKRCEDIVGEARFISQNVEKLAETNCCVLVRTNAYAMNLSKHVDPNKFFVVQDFQYYKRSEVKEITAFLKLILNPYDTVALERLTLKYVRGFGEIKLADVISDDVYGLGVRLSDFLDLKTHLGGGDAYALLNERLNDGEIVVFDTETTGTDTDRDEIIQIAAIKINSFGEETERLNLLVKNSKPVGDSVAVHGIDDQKLANFGTDKKTALKRLTDFIGNSLVVGHNVSFDLGMLNAELEKAGMPIKKYPFYDTYLLAKRFLPEQANYKLENLSRNLKLDYKSSHDALDDVKATACLLTYIVNNRINPTLNERVNAVKPYIGLFKNLAFALEDFRTKLYELPFTSFLKQVVSGLNIRNIYKNQETALFNIEQFIKIGELLSFNTHNAYNSLRNVINLASFSAGDLDALAKEQNLIPIITVHQSKGCEFNDVYIAGLCEGGFPSYFSIKNNTEEEEKRLFYVAFTRAKNRVFLLTPEYDYDKRGQKHKATPSRFLSFIPHKFLKEIK